MIGRKTGQRKAKILKFQRPIARAGASPVTIRQGQVLRLKCRSRGRDVVLKNQAIRDGSRSDLAGPSSGWHHAARIWVPLEFRSRLSAAGTEFESPDLIGRWSVPVQGPFRNRPLDLGRAGRQRLARFGPFNCLALLIAVARRRPGLRLQRHAVGGGDHEHHGSEAIGCPCASAETSRSSGLLRCSVAAPSSPAAP
jgi:hypothetical protein